MKAQPPPTLLSRTTLNEVMQFLLSSPKGPIVEVGVYKGGTAYYFAQVAAARFVDLHLFDTFTGMPHSQEGLDRHPVGDFGDTSLEAVQQALKEHERYITYHPGVFPETLPADLRDIAFVHVDCDQYQSVKDCCEWLWPRLMVGGKMCFDDYPYLPGAEKAVAWFLDSEILQYTKWTIDRYSGGRICLIKM